MEAKIDIKMKQVLDKVDKDNIEFTTEGKFYEKNGKYYIMYDETEVTGMEGCKTTIKIDGHKVYMKRTGSSNSDFEFEKNKTYHSFYRTPYGIFDMTVKTEKLVIAINEDKAKIQIKYDLDIKDLVKSKNDISIEVKIIH